MFTYDIKTDRFLSFEKHQSNDSWKENPNYSRYILNTSQNRKKVLHELKKSPIELCVEITDYCNLSCPICIADAGKDGKKFLDIERFSYVLDQLHGKVQRVCITGGEPLFHPEIEKIIDISTKYYPTILSTNGYLFDFVDYLSQKYNNIIFAISMHGPQNIHDQYVGVDGSYSHAVSSINFALSNSALVQVYTVVSQFNIDVIPDLIDTLREYPIVLHKIMTIKQKGRVSYETDEKNLLNIITKCKKSTKSKIQIDSFPYYILNSNGALEVANGYER
ncbi:MAG: MoaA/NifB/PqqE/SkfB family radical SAM enzyme [Desulforhopalus sp.]|jgi:MoaA/NifB/PqqE/SkfB family radical SAM enzyme